MCLGVPVRIEKVKGKTAVASVDGLRRSIGIDLTPDVRPGEYVLLHAGFAIEKIDAQEARETLRLLKEFLGPDGS